MESHIQIQNQVCYHGIPARGWCSYCRGYGKIYEWMKEELPANGKWWQMEDGETCTECKGERLNPIARNIVLYDGKKNKLSLPQLLRPTPEEIISFLQNIKLEKRVQTIAAAIIPEIIEKLSFMKKVGLDYLSLDRETSSLSGGEAQRIRLAGQLGSNLSGVLYILDEPSIGLHPKDNQKLLQTLRALKVKVIHYLLLNMTLKLLHKLTILLILDQVQVKMGEK